MTSTRLALTRDQILAFRQRAGGLTERLPHGAASLRQAAWAGLQDSMPRAALLSIHARVAGTQPSDWEHPALVQVWGPHYSVFVVPAQDVAVFTVALLPEDGKGRRRAEDLAARLHEQLGGQRASANDAGRALGIWPGALLVGGEITGTWRRAGTVLSVQTWRPLSPAERDAVLAEAESLPLPGAAGQITVRWAG